mmetsp:Transcript_21557/g.41868  ORF Transcript_21557/g.41868 Transcript_21557/m.41868 type:complete len:82 (+) Transcript_21557:236-481(+)
MYEKWCTAVESEVAGEKDHHAEKNEQHHHSNQHRHRLKMMMDISTWFRHLLMVCPRLVDTEYPNHHSSHAGYGDEAFLFLL